jgi:hypothetical protein
MKKSIIALFLLTSAAAFANEAGDDMANRTAAGGERTRAEVKAETLAAKQQGTLSFSEFAANQQQASQGTGRSRTELRAEAVQAARTRVIHEQI